MSQTKIEGEYFFRKMEMVSGFNFSADGKFQFFYSYGAVDRTADGHFTVHEDSLLLVSDKQPGKDFSISSESKQGKGYVLTFRHPNKYLLKYISCVFVVDGQQQEAHSDENGVVMVDLAHCDTIYALHNLYPDVPTLVKDAKDDHNNFILELKPSLEQVSFHGMSFKIIDGKTIDCVGNYFIDSEKVQFSKE